MFWEYPKCVENILSALLISEMCQPNWNRNFQRIFKINIIFIQNFQNTSSTFKMAQNFCKEPKIFETQGRRSFWNTPHILQIHTFRMEIEQSVAIQRVKNLYYFKGSKIKIFTKTSQNYSLIYKYIGYLPFRTSRMCIN